MRYRTIVADPPWSYPGGFKRSVATSRAERGTSGTLERREMPFDAMTLDEIRALRVDRLANPYGCRLFLWATNTYLPAAFDVMRTWGFDYAQAIVWHKPNSSPWPTSIAPNQAEFLLVGNFGKPERLNPWGASVFSHSVPKGHSAKPEMFLDLIEQVSPTPRIELFARRNRLGWHTWGNEALPHVELPA